MLLYRKKLYNCIFPPLLYTLSFCYSNAPSLSSCAHFQNTNLNAAPDNLFIKAKLHVCAFPLATWPGLAAIFPTAAVEVILLLLEQWRENAKRKVNKQGGESRQLQTKQQWGGGCNEIQIENQSEPWHAVRQGCALEISLTLYNEPHAEKCVKPEPACSAHYPGKNGKKK